MKASRRDALLMLLLVCVVFVACLTLMIVCLSSGDTQDKPGSESPTFISESASSDHPAMSDVPDSTISSDASDSPAPSVQPDLSASPTTVTPIGKACPLALQSSSVPLEYQEGVFCETWRGLSDKSCKDLAAQTLVGLQQAQAQLIHAGYLDIEGEAWGCAIKTVDEEALTITLIPQDLGAARAEDNQLCMTVLRIRTPDFALSGSSGSASDE